MAGFEVSTEAGERHVLQELTTSQPRGEPRRRWFADEYFDLIVWFGEDGSRCGFQLCYDRGPNERALTWTATAGYSHHRIDGGEPDPTRNRTPILLPDGRFAVETILRRFEASSAQLEAPLRDFVLDTLRGYPESREGGGL
jgi:hypothetical protein